MKYLKFILVIPLALVYWPINMIFLAIKKHYFKWKKEDRISYIIATPLYYLSFMLVSILSVPLEIMGEGLHPPLDSFK